MKEDVLSASETDIFKWVKINRAEFAKLKQEEKFRREFIGNLAHELKTPIFSIQGYILTLLEGGIDDKNVNRKFLNIALNGVERMNQIISDLDMITKFESEKIDMEFPGNFIGIQNTANTNHLSGVHSLYEVGQGVSDGTWPTNYKINQSLRFENASSSYLS